MSHNPELIPSLDCEHASVSEYWHDNDNCPLEDCAVIECLTCEQYATECEQA